MSGYRLIVADDHPLVRDALSQTFATSYPDGQIDDPAGGRTLIYRHPAPGGHQNA